MENRAPEMIHRSISGLRPFTANARTHTRRQIRQIADSIARFGFTNPVLVSDQSDIIAGHGRVQAAKLLGHETVPTLQLSHLTPAELRAYVIADNKLAANAGWDNAILAIELQSLIDLDFDVSLTGFSVSEIDCVLDGAASASPTDRVNETDKVPAVQDRAVTRRGDIWQLGRHRLRCGDARSPDDYLELLCGKQADLIFTDPPYNVPIDGNVSGLGRVQHREFAMGSGEMSKSEFTSFLTDTLSNAAESCRDGAIAYVCMDWRHFGEIVTAGEVAFDELKNVCVWNKTNAGMGTFYRSKHEHVFVFKKGKAPHVNNFGLGDGGRYRTNVWDYAGIGVVTNPMSGDLSMHPTVKPVALVADAMRDCSKRGSIVLDPFAGSGTTVIAAEITGRIAYVLEYDPLYCDTILRRFAAVTGKQATLAGLDESFDDLAAKAERDGDVT